MLCELIGIPNNYIASLRSALSKGGEFAYNFARSKVQFTLVNCIPFLMGLHAKRGELDGFITLTYAMNSTYAHS